VVKEYGIVKLVKNQKKQKEQIGNGKIVRKQIQIQTPKRRRRSEGKVNYDSYKGKLMLQKRII
jgi:hypothetical protein